MEKNQNSRPRQFPGRCISIVIVSVAAVLGLFVLYRANYQPRTEDAEIFANFIGIAPQVGGPLVRLNVKDNQFVKKGELLYEIDERPYQYALENAMSEQATLEGQIADEQRKIAALVSAVSVAQANIHGSEAAVANAEQGVARARAEWTYANNNLHRLEPLLTKQFVTMDEVDKARSGETAQAEALRQAESRLQLAKAELISASAQHEQAGHAVTTLEPLINQRGARAAAVKTARYNLDSCRVYAPFDALVTNLTISEGAYAHVGQQVFTLIDARTWWAVGNFAFELARRAAVPRVRDEADLQYPEGRRAIGRSGHRGLEARGVRHPAVNTRHRLIKMEMVSVGSLAASVVHPREVFRPAVLAAAASVILAHNHPSGDPAPSEDDVEITQRLVKTGELLGIEVLDHVIVGANGSFVSSRERGLI